MATWGPDGVMYAGGLLPLPCAAPYVATEYGAAMPGR